jgi:hypothetical protein
VTDRTTPRDRSPAVARKRSAIFIEYPLTIRL